MSDQSYSRTLPRVLSPKMFPVELLEDEQVTTAGLRKQHRALSVDRTKGFHLLQHSRVDPLLDSRFTATQQLIWELNAQGYSSLEIARLVSKPEEFYFATIADVKLALNCVKDAIN